MEKELDNNGLSGPNKRNRNWQLLLVDDHGKMVTFPWLKGAVLAMIAALLFFMISSFFMFYLYQKHLLENRRLQGTLNASEEQVRDLLIYMDILLAKLVLAESKLTSPSSETAEKQPPDGKPKNTEKEEAAAPPAEKQRKPAPPPLKPIGLEITNFQISQESLAPGILKISFKIKNVDPAIKTASGYIFIVLKPDKDRPESWFSVPSSELRAGYPANARKGQFFRISRFKTVYFRANTRIPLKQLATASVFVLNKKNERLFEKDFPIIHPADDGDDSSSAAGATPGSREEVKEAP